MRHTRVPLDGNFVAFHEHLAGHPGVALQLAFQYHFHREYVSLMQLAMVWVNVRPGHSEKDTTPFFLSFSVKATENRILAVFDCAYAIHGLYVLPPWT